MQFYDEWARQILDGRLTEHLAFYGLPLYAYLLALIYKLVGYGPFVPGLLQAAFDAGTATILYQLGTHVFASDKIGRASASGAPQLIGASAAFAWALFAPAQAYAVILMPTVWFVFVFWFVTWRIVRNESPPAGRECLWLGLLIGISAMGVATILLLVPLVLAALIFKPRIDSRDRARPPCSPISTSVVLAMALLFAGIAAGTSPCWIHNYLIARDPVLLSAHSGINFWIGNNPDSNGYPRFPPGLRAGQTAMLEDSITRAEVAAGHPLKRGQVSAYWSAKAKAYIANHFADWLKLLTVKLRNFWSAFQYDDLSIITILRDEGVILPGLHFGVVAAFGLPGMIIGWLLAPRSRWITAAILLQMLAVLTVFTTERYRLAAVPGLLLLDAFGLSIFWQGLATRKFRVTAVYAGLLIASTTFVAWPQRDPSLWALDAYNSGRQALESNNLPLAEKKLHVAYAYVPGNAETNFALGNLRLAEQNRAAAESYYLTTLQLDPTHAGAYNNLGVLALDQNQYNTAADYFAKALKQNPRNAKTYYLLAQAHLKTGEIDRARTEISKALSLNPTQAEFRELRMQIEQTQPATP